MNEWLADPRAKRGEEHAFEAELAETSGEWAKAKDLYRAAAADYVPLAYAIPPEEPHARAAIGISAVACLARAGDFGRAIDVANRLLAQGGALSQRGRTELARMAANYAEIVAAQRMGTKASARPHRMRAVVRSTDGKAKDAA